MSELTLDEARAQIARFEDMGAVEQMREGPDYWVGLVERLLEEAQVMRAALQGFVDAIEQSDSITIRPSYDQLEKALHEADRVLASPPSPELLPPSAELSTPVEGGE